MIKKLKNWLKEKAKIILIFLGFISICVAADNPLKNEVSLDKVQEKYNASTEIRAKYQMEGASLMKQDIKNAELDKYQNEPKDEVRVIIGDNEPVFKEGFFGAGTTTTEFKPNIELKRWNEVSFKIKTDKLLEGVATKDKELSFNKDKIRFDTPKISFEMYDYAEGEGGYKYVWYLNEKPATNKIEFQIESSGLDFYYQPPLTQEYQNGFSEEFQKEIVVSETQVKDLEGNVLVERPENVVGSYAVYHSTKGGMVDSWGKDYKTGQAFFIYPSHLTDTEGKTSKAILKIENGIFSEEIPQKFLDKAIFPIKGNAELGFHTKGGTTGTLARDTIRIYQTDAPTSNGTIIDVGIYSNNGAYAMTARGVVYLDSDKSRVSFGSEVTIPVSYDNWTTLNITDTAITNGTNYDFGAWQYCVNIWNNYYNSVAGTNLLRDNTVYHSTNDPPVTFTTASTLADRKYSIYATYTPSGGGTPIDYGSDGGASSGINMEVQVIE